MIKIGQGVCTSTIDVNTARKNKVALGLNRLVIKPALKQAQCALDVKASVDSSDKSVAACCAFNQLNAHLKQISSTNHFHQRHKDWALAQNKTKA